jgi:type III pantothenate kinase
MILTIDIGNSSTKLGVYDNENLVKRLIIPTIRSKTADEIYQTIQEELNFRFSAVVISSVVTELREAFLELGEKYFNRTPVFVDNSFDFGLTNKYSSAETLGVDRIIAAFAAVEKYRAPVIVCDFGTAANFEVVNAKREYLGGIIAPGIQTLADSLFLKTSKLPRVEVKKTAKVIENSTISCIQSGVFYGYIGLTEGILHRMIVELGEKPKVIATGGFAKLIADNCELIEIVDENLMLDGLRLIYDKFRVTA